MSELIWALSQRNIFVCLLSSVVCFRVLAYIQIATFIVVLMSVSWILSTFFFQSLLSSWGPAHSSSWSCSVSSLCCGLEEDEDLEEEVEQMKKAFTVSDTLVSAISHHDMNLDYRHNTVNGYHPEETRQHHQSDMIALGLRRTDKSGLVCSPYESRSQFDGRSLYSDGRSHYDLKSQTGRKSSNDVRSERRSQHESKSPYDTRSHYDFDIRSPNQEARSPYDSRSLYEKRSQSRNQSYAQEDKISKSPRVKEKRSQSYSSSKHTSHNNDANNGLRYECITSPIFWGLLT